MGQILLTVQVCDVHPVKIRQDQPADTGARQCDGNIGTQTAQTADSHSGSAQFFLPFFPLFQFQCPAEFFLRGDRAHISRPPQS